MVPPDSHEIPRVPRYSGTSYASAEFRIQGYHLLWQNFPDLSAIHCRSFMEALQPRLIEISRFGLFPFRSPLLRESRLISIPPGTEMFQFPGFSLTDLWIQPVIAGHSPCRVSPFGNPRINACLRLPEAYRSLPRPSSPPRAKASTVRP